MKAVVRSLPSFIQVDESWITLVADDADFRSLREGAATPSSDFSGVLVSIDAVGNDEGCLDDRDRRAEYAIHLANRFLKCVLEDLLLCSASGSSTTLMLML